MLLSCPCSDESVCGVGRRYATAATAASGLALSVTFGDSSPKGGASGVSVGFHAGRPRPDRTQKGGPCYRGQARLRITSQSHSVRQGRVAAPSVCCAAACIPLAAAPTAPPCFGHWPRSSPLPLLGELSAKQTERLYEGKPDREPPAGLPSQSPSVTAPPKGEALAFRIVSCIFLAKFMIYLFCGLARPFYWEGRWILWCIYSQFWSLSQQM